MQQAGRHRQHDHHRSQSYRDVDDMVSQAQRVVVKTVGGLDRAGAVYLDDADGKQHRHGSDQQVSRKYGRYSHVFMITLVAELAISQSAAPGV